MGIPVPLSSRILILTASSMILLVGIGGCTQQPDGNALGARAQAAADRQRAELTQLYRETLQDPSQDRAPSTRRAAAIALLVANTPEAIDTLSQGLTSGQPTQVQAVLAALVTQDQPDQKLKASALMAIENCPPMNRASLGSLLARYSETDPGIIKQLIGWSQNRTATLSSRETAIRCLGEFHSEAALVTSVLIDLLKESDQPGILDATNTSLEQLTGIRAQTRTQWRAWWQEHRDRPPSTWMRDTIQVQNRRITELEETLQRDRQRDQLVINRLIGVYRELWPLLPMEEQLAGIPSMLQDTLPDIRRFAVDRVAVLLRDGEATPAIEQAVLQGLEDTDLEVRRKVAALLEELSNPQLTALLEERLRVETDPVVLNSTLRFLNARGNSEQLPSILPLLKNEQTREAAIETTWSLLRDARSSQAINDVVLEALQSVPLDADNPEETALLILVSPDGQLVEFESYLDDEDPLIRSAAATAFLRRDRRDPVITRGQDSSIYPIALEAALSLPADQPIERINQILKLEPPQPTQEALWVDAIMTASQAVPIQKQITIDDQLALNDRVRDTTRIRILDQAQARESIAADDQALILKRLAPLLIKANKSKTAVILLEPFYKNDEDLAQLRFIAALHDRDFDSASSVYGELARWLDAYEMLRESHPDASVAVRDEITQRFNNELDSETRARLDISVDPMMVEPGSSVETTGGTNDHSSR